MDEAIAIIRLVWDILGPVAEKMVERGLAGGDPRDVLRDERVADILPPESETEKAMRAALAAKRGG